MELLKSIVLTACICAILSAGMRMISPDNMKNELRMICTLVMLVCITSQVIGMKIVPVSIGGEDTGVEDYRAAVLEESRQGLEDRLREKLEGDGVFAEDVSIDCSFDEYNYVEADRVYILLDAGSEQTDTAYNVARELFENAEIEVMENEGDARQAAEGQG